MILPPSYVPMTRNRRRAIEIAAALTLAGGVLALLSLVPGPPDNELPAVVILPVHHSALDQCPPGYGDPEYIGDGSFQCVLDTREAGRGDVPR